jgi:signal transduction histidine kinase
MSIQHRLQFLICILLLSAIALFSFASYYGLKQAAMAIGEERIHSLTDELSSMFGQSAGTLKKTIGAAANQNFVKQYIKSGGRDFRNETLEALDKLHRDSNWVLVELLDSGRVPILRSNKSTTEINISNKEILSLTNIGPDSGKVGKIYNLNGSMYYPAVATVTNNKNIIGYIVCWQVIHASPKTVKQFSQLMGTGAALYVGNTDGSLWTNMIKPVKGPVVKIDRTHPFFEYSNPDGKKVIASAQLIPNTNWLIFVDFPEEKILEAVNRFVDGMSFVGIILTAIGFFAAWAMSRNITRPLSRLTLAATAISEGDYSYSVPVGEFRSDELKKLANAFNLMAAEVNRMHLDLESKVAARTTQLENVNKELEAFSYSVSHDLRTPLRAINGYSMMLIEDYENELDAEAKRIVHNIISNAKMMGQLIDDLLAFSRLGKKELARTLVDMQAIATTVVNDLLQQEAENKYDVRIGSLSPAKADGFMIKQVLTNLVSNAIKYSSKKTMPLIEIGSDNDGKRVVYFVKDNGVGFDMAYSAKLFGVFQRLHSQEEFEGSGVGLALVRRIIDKHKGEVWAEAEENNGASFYFSLPNI